MMSGITEIARQAVKAAINANDKLVAQLYREACTAHGVTPTGESFSEAFALECARAIESSDYRRFDILFDAIQDDTGISREQIFDIFCAEGADPALVPSVKQARYFGSLSAVKG